MGSAMLSQDGEVISRRDGAHVAAPVVPLIDALLDRLRRENRGIAAGEVITLGSLSGMPPIPAAGAEYLGEVGQLTPLPCRVAPV
jgi:2-keto-4-pentenoate hydratase